MLSEKDRRDYKKGIQDIYIELGTTKIKYYPLNPRNEDDIYEEETESYGEPINLIADIEAKDPLENAIDPIPSMGVVIYVIDIPILCLEEKELDPFSMITGKFEFEGQEYKIVDVIPDGLFTDFYTSYKFQCQII